MSTHTLNGCRHHYAIMVQTLHRLEVACMPNASMYNPASKPTSRRPLCPVACCMASCKYDVGLRQAWPSAAWLLPVYRPSSRPKHVLLLLIRHFAWVLLHCAIYTASLASVQLVYASYS